MQGYQYSAMSMTPQAMRNIHKSDVQKPKRAKFWPFQNFPGTNIMFFQQKTINLVSMAKNMNIYSSVWDKQAKMGIFWQKRTNFVKKCQIGAIS